MQYIQVMGCNRSAGREKLYISKMFKIMYVSHHTFFTVYMRLELNLRWSVLFYKHAALSPFISLAKKLRFIYQNMLVTLQLCTVVKPARNVHNLLTSVFVVTMFKFN